MSVLSGAKILFVLIVRAQLARLQTDAASGCKKVMKVNYCPLQITEYLLSTLGGRSEKELACINEFCDQEMADPAVVAKTCCSVKAGIKEQLQDRKLTGGLSESALTKLRKVVGAVGSEPRPADSEQVSKPIWEIEAENLAAAQQTSENANASTTDERCVCPIGRSNGRLGEYARSQLFSQNGYCTSSTACNECYHGDTNGVFGCCLKNSNGAATNCAPPFKKPNFNGESCFCGGKVLKSWLYEQGAKHCRPDTDCGVCKSGCSNR
jgi:hypothetical protein